MVVGGQYDGGGGTLDFSFSLFQMFCQSQVFYFGNIVKQCILFNNLQHFVFMYLFSRPYLISYYYQFLIIIIIIIYIFNIKMVGMLKDMKNREMCGVSLVN